MTGDSNADGTGAADSTGPGATGDTGEAPQSCANGEFDPGEEDIDCGGRCDPCPGVAFEPEPTVWSVPDVEFGLVTDVVFRWSTFDIDGDGRADLVHTFEGGGNAFGEDGAPHWRVYFNDGAGFSDTFMQWPIPGPEFFTTSRPSGAHDEAAWSTLDIDGDGLVDLVVTSLAGQAFGDADEAHWRVYFNDGAGFSETPSPWPVPDLALADTTGVLGTLWTTVDLDGGGAPSLVYTSPDGVAAYGDDRGPHWRVHENLGDGFASAPSMWAVPDLEIATLSSTQSRQWSTLDIDGDGRADLVETGLGTMAFGGEAPHWRVFSGQAGGFAATHEPWSVPDARFSALTGPGASWFSIDLDGEGTLDLVESDAGSGVAFGGAADPHWRLHANDADGFARASAWPVPTENYWTLAEPEVGGWTALDVDGDGRVDLVETTESSLTALGGAEDPHWLVYFNTTTPQ